MVNYSLRKFNSILVILIFILLCLHSLLSALLFLNWIGYTPMIKVYGLLLLAIVFIHIIISLHLFLKDRKNQKRIRLYNHINNESSIQAYSGVLIIVCIVLHILSYIFLPAYIPILSWKIAHLLVDTLLFIMLFIHLQLSIPRLLMSLGFLTEDDSYDNCKRYFNIILGVLVVILFLVELSYYIL